MLNASFSSLINNLVTSLTTSFSNCKTFFFSFRHGWLVIQWSWFKFINGSMSREIKRFYTTLIEDLPRKETTLMNHKIWMHHSKHVVYNFVLLTWINSIIRFVKWYAKLLNKVTQSCSTSIKLHYQKK